MRKLIACTIMSLDGYFEGPGGDVTALPLDHAFDSYNAERLRAADTLLLGRTTYEGFLSFWPRQADHTDPQLLELLAGQDERLATIREISRLNNAIEKVVISDSLTAERTEPWRDTTRIVARAEAHEQVASLKRQPGRDIVVFGSGTLWNDLLGADLVDELHLMIGPVVLAAGTPAFGGAQPASLRLLDARIFEGSGNLLVRYATAR